MGHHQHRSGVREHARQRANSARPHACETLRAFGRCLAFDPCLEPSIHRLALALSERGFAKLGLDADGRCKSQARRHDFGRAPSPRKRRAHNRGNPRLSQNLTGFLGLRNAGGVQRNIDIALGEILRVPIRLSVTEIPERLCRKRAQAKPSCCMARATAGRARIRA